MRRMHSESRAMRVPALSQVGSAASAFAAPFAAGRLFSALCASTALLGFWAAQDAFRLRPLRLVRARWAHIPDDRRSVVL